jgi:uncharacterized protein
VPGPRPEPIRTCVGCRGTASKRDLLRVVRAHDGGVVLDPTGKAQGRGAYVHAEPGCWDVALMSGALARALRTGLTLDEAGTLLMQLKEATSR